MVIKSKISTLSSSEPVAKATVEQGKSPKDRCLDLGREPWWEWAERPDGLQRRAGGPFSAVPAGLASRPVIPWAYQPRGPAFSF